jgi:predicted nucleic acid-binding protein
MISALDTNILLDVLIPNDAFFANSLRCIEESLNDGSCVICDYAYAELCVHFSTQKECDLFLNENEIRVESLSREAHFVASRAWQKYRAQGGKRMRILSDFFVAAHAQTQADRLFTRDRGFYSELFPSLKIVDPSAK